MEQKYHYLIKVLSEGGVWYTNALVENSFDAIAVAKFYREQLGYSVQLWHKEEEVSHLIDGAGKIVSHLIDVANNLPNEKTPG